MIILDSDPSSKQQQAAQDRAPTPTPTPEYTYSEYTPLLQPPPAYTPADDDDRTIHQEDKRLNSWRSRRRLLALAVVLVFCVIGLDFASDGARSPVASPRSSPWPGKEKAQTEYCLSTAQWSVRAGRLQHDIDLPYNSFSTFLVSSGSSKMTGVVEVSAAPADDHPDDIRVSISVVDASRRGASSLSVCRLSQGKDHHGIGLVNEPTSDDTDDPLSLRIRVVFPYATVWPVPFLNFSSHLPLFAHHFSMPSDVIRFGELSLRTEAAPITVEKTMADRVDLITSDAPISAELLLTMGATTLATSRAPVHANITVHSAERNFFPTSVNITTDRAPINATFSTLSSQFHLGLFDLSLHNARGDITARVAPIPTTPQAIRLRARTSHAHAAVAMHPAFQGKFAVSAEQAEVSVREDAPDPAGRGRTRRVRADEVRWVPDGACDEEMGALDVRVEEGSARVEFL